MSIEQLINELIYFINHIITEADEIKYAINCNTNFDNELKTKIINLLESYNYIAIQSEQGVRSLLINNDNLKEEIEYIKKAQYHKASNTNLISIDHTECFSIYKKQDTLNKFFSPNTSTTQNFYLINTAQNKEIIKSPDKSCLPTDFQHIYKNTNENERKAPLRNKLRRSNSQREIKNDINEFKSEEEIDVLSNLINQISTNLDLKLFFSDKYGEGSFNNFIYKLKMKYVTLEMIDIDLGLIIDYKSNIEKNIKLGLEKKKYNKK
jgi:hypothetical protein